jgi:hypothetical protein
MLHPHMTEHGRVASVAINGEPAVSTAGFHGIAMKFGRVPLSAFRELGHGTCFTESRTIPALFMEGLK